MAEIERRRKTFPQKLYDFLIPLLAGLVLGIGSWVVDIDAKVQRHEEYIMKGDRFFQEDADALVEKVIAIDHSQAELRAEVAYLHRTLNKTNDLLEKLLLERRNLKSKEN